MKRFLQYITTVMGAICISVILCGCTEKYPTQLYILTESSGTQFDIDYSWCAMRKESETNPASPFYYFGVWTGNAIANTSKSESPSGHFYRFHSLNVATGELARFVVYTESRSAVASRLGENYLKNSTGAKFEISKEPTGLRLKWDTMSGVSHYYVFSKTVVEQTLSLGFLCRTSETSWIDEKTSAEGLYEYVVIGYKESIGLDENTAITGKSYVENKGSGSGSSTTGSVPTNLTIETSQSCLSLEWNGVDDAKTYKVYRATNPNGTWAYYASTSNEYYDDCSVSKGVTYYYKVSANNGSKDGEKSSYVYGSISNSGGSGGSGGDSTTKPGTPYGLSAEANQSYIELSWNSVNGATKYNVYRSTSAYGTYSFIKTVYSAYYDDYSVSNGNTYYYKVSAENSAGEGSKSSYVSCKFGTSGGGGGSTTINYEPCPPSVTCSGTSSVTIRWTAPTSSGCGRPTYYTVRRINKIDNNAETLVEKTTSTSYTDTKPYPGINTYGVIAYNDYGSATGMAISSEVGVPTPTITKVAPSQKSLDITVSDLNVPDVWKQYFSLELYSTLGGSSSQYYADRGFKYSDATKSGSALVIME